MLCLMLIFNVQQDSVKLVICDFRECCGNCIASVVHKCYICGLQFEHAEGEELVTARRFIVMADYIDQLKCV